jgi:hypothetical protein
MSGMASSNVVYDLTLELARSEYNRMKREKALNRSRCIRYFVSSIIKYGSSIYVFPLKGVIKHRKYLA